MSSLSPNLTTIAVTDGVATLTLNDPARRNALSAQMIRELTEHLIALPSHVRVVILTGEGEKAFCAGADLAASLAHPTHEARDKSNQAIERLFVALTESPVPIIAAINGPALAGGFGLVLASHLAVTTDTAIFGTPEINVGLWPLMVTALLRRTIGEKRALDLALTGAPISAATALEWGIVNRVVTREELLPTAHSLASTLTQRSPSVISHGLDAWRSTDLGPVRQPLAELRSRLTDLMETPDAHEGMTAFLEKRKPQFPTTEAPAHPLSYAAPTE